MKWIEVLFPVRTLLIILYVILAVVVFGTLAILASFLDKQGNWPHIVARSWAWSILFVSRTRVRISGLSRIDLEKPYIFMPNHTSNFDIPVLLAHLPVQFRWLAKAELFRFPLFGYAMKRAGYISIDRSNRKSAFESLEKAAEAIRKGKSVLIFPEGTRSRDNTLHEFKKGGFVLAIKSGVPIVPVIIHGTWNIMSKNGLTIRPGNVLLEILDPIPTSGYTVSRKGELIQQLHSRMTEELAYGKQ